MRTLTYNLNKHVVEVVLNDNLITISLAGQSFFAKYPVRIEDADEYLINLMIWILFWGFEENPRETIDDYTNEVPIKGDFSPNNNDKYLISFSGGVDSTAVFMSIEDKNPESYYLVRSYQDDFNVSQRPIIDQIGGKYIETDTELIRKIYGKSHGYNIGIGYMALYFPLINILKVKYITFGVVFDDLGFWYGEPFKFNGVVSFGRTDFIKKILSLYGIEMVFLFAGVSEVNTVKMVNASRFKNVACSCHHNSILTNACGTCYKCFRKLNILGKRLNLNQNSPRGGTVRDEVMSILSHKPLKMAASLVYGIQKANYGLPEFQRYLDIDVSFCNRYNDVLMKRFNTAESYALMTDYFKKIGITKQTDQDLQNIEKFVVKINDDNLYKF